MNANWPRTFVAIIVQVQILLPMCMLILTQVSDSINVEHLQLNFEKHFCTEPDTKIIDILALRHITQS